MASPVTSKEPDATAEEQKDQSKVESSHTKLVVLGGVGRAYNACNEQCYIMDTEVGFWEHLCDLPEPMVEFALHMRACVMEDKIIISGGNNRQVSSKMVWSFDISDRKWKQLPDTNEKHELHGMAAAERTLYVIGGRYICATEKLDLSNPNPHWKCCAAIPECFGLIGALNVNNQIYTFGSLRTYAYSIKDDIWTKKAYMPVGGHWETAAATKDKIFLMGDNRCFSYDMVTDTWSHCLARPAEFHQFAAAAYYEERDTILLGGGSKYGGCAKARTRFIEEYNIKLNEWTRYPYSLPKVMSYHFMLAIR